MFPTEHHIRFASKASLPNNKVQKISYMGSFHSKPRQPALLGSLITDAVLYPESRFPSFIDQPSPRPPVQPAKHRFWAGSAHSKGTQTKYYIGGEKSNNTDDIPI